MTQLHPLHGANRLKLGTFAMNCSGGCAITAAPEAHAIEWRRNTAIAKHADATGFELLVPIARWRGFGGVSDYNGSNFETFTWGAGMAQATNDIGIMSTCHVPLIHPLVAAKQGVTIDHISGGRWGLNIVCGWARTEMEMFGTPMLSHEARYDYAAEWIEIVKRAWSATAPFDFEGKYLRVQNAVSWPKPLSEMPPLMNAGGSPRGQKFCAEYCDIAFVLLEPGNMPSTRQRIADYRHYAREEFGRELKIWANGYVVQADTQAAADAALHRYAVEHGDDVAVENLASELGVADKLPSREAYETFKYHFKAGAGGYPLVGTAERIADTLHALADAGLDGMLLSWLDYGEGLAAWNETVAPKLRAAGLRH
jgi:alkanesulfonate monooxygenase SsuD/methylene tetrahydromethanopterin reductase-like flavin-dependent oxidoreductase (luciferase family)